MITRGVGRRGIRDYTIVLCKNLRTCVRNSQGASATSIPHSAQSSLPSTRNARPASHELLPQRTVPRAAMPQRLGHSLEGFSERQILHIYLPQGSLHWHPLFLAELGALLIGNLPPSQLQDPRQTPGLAWSCFGSLRLTRSPSQTEP